MRAVIRTLAMAAAMLAQGFGGGSAARAETPADAGRLAPFFASLSACQIFHLTPAGYLRLAPSRYFTTGWDQATVDDLARDARQRPFLSIDLRSTIHLQLSNASSYQAATAYRALHGFMREEGIEALRRPDIVAAAESAYRARLQADGMAACFVVKWGNRHPDVFAQPMRTATWDAIAALFGANAPSDFPLSEVERQALSEGRLSMEEIVELRAIRIAAFVFENEFAVLKSDRGGFGGNLDDDAFVCTDEATTQWYFLAHLERAGLLRRFSTQDGRFVHRRPTLILPSDHFGVLLRNLRSGEYFVLDSWVEDGGLPPHVSTIEDWYELHERRSIASIGDPELDAALEAGQVTHEDSDGALTRLRDLLSRFAPAEQAARGDGRPPTCDFQWCGGPPSPELIATW